MGAEHPIKQRNSVGSSLLDRVGEIMVKSAELRTRDEDTRAAEAVYVASLAAELAATMESPALIDMPLYKLVLNPKRNVLGFTVKAKGKPVEIYIMRPARDANTLGQQRHGALGERPEADPHPAAAFGVTTEGELYIGTGKGRYEPAGETIPEVMEYFWPSAWGNANYTTRAGKAVEDFEDLVEKCKAIGQAYADNVEARLQKARAKTRQG